MTRLLRWLSAAFFAAALAGIGFVLLTDTVNRLRLTTAHQRVGALSFMLIGASYITLQLSAPRPKGETLRGVLLGVAFFLWGGEQFLPPSRLVTVMDSLVVVIFVLDLGSIIVSRLRRGGKDENGQ